MSQTFLHHFYSNWKKQMGKATVTKKGVWHHLAKAMMHLFFMMFEASCTVYTQSVSSHSVVKPVLKSMQSHGAHGIFLHLQTHGCNRIKAFGLWEFQTKTCIFSLIITKSMRLKALAILMAILQAPPRHVRHYSCISTKQSTSNSYFCVLNSKKVLDATKRSTPCLFVSLIALLLLKVGGQLEQSNHLVCTLHI